MTAAALLALFSATGVGFGWQPMPDGSPRYEYVVQVEPEMLDALADGQSIPIVSEVPEDAQPIGRIRVVVGRNELPRERLAITRLKPASTPRAEAKSRDGVVLTQFTEPPAPRYGTPPSAAPPASAFYDPYTQAPPAATAPSASGTGWNGGVPQVADASAAASPLDQVGAGIQQATAPIRDGFGRIDDSVRSAADSLGDQTRGVLDQLLPSRPAMIIGRSDDAPPTTIDATKDAAAAGSGWNGGAANVPPVAAAAAPTTEAPGWNGGAAPTAPPATTAAPIAASEPRSNWNPDPPPATAPLVGAGSDGSEAPPLVMGGVPPQGRGADGDPWNNVADERLRSGGLGVPAPPLSVDTSAPPSATTAGTGQGGRPGPQLVPPADSGLTATGGAPMITSSMLDQLATRPLDDLNPNAASKLGSSLGGSLGFTPASGPPSSSPFATSPFPSTPPQVRDATADEKAAVPNPAPINAAEPPASARNRAAVIIAWVLLTGSAAGNFYLFWSYLDVRTKYRALVRKTARAVGSRFSAA